MLLLNFWNFILIGAYYVHLINHFNKWLNDTKIV